MLLQTSEWLIYRAALHWPTINNHICIIHNAIQIWSCMPLHFTRLAVNIDFAIATARLPFADLCSDWDILNFN